MKKLSVALLLIQCLNLSVWAQEVEIDRITVMQGFDIRFKLDHSAQSEEYIILDCQSFFQKFDFYNKQNNLLFENYITINECEFLYQKTISCLKEHKRKCFNSDDIFSQDCECSESLNSRPSKYPAVMP